MKCNHEMTRLCRWAASACPLWFLPVTLLILVGCETGHGIIAVKSATDPKVTLTSQFTSGVYGYEDKNTLHVMLLDEAEKGATRALHIRMFWSPVAGATPIDRNAVNATVRYVVFLGDSVAVYEGAGFLHPKTPPGSPTFTATLEGATMRILDSTEGFTDKIGLALASGRFSAVRNDTRALDLYRKLQERVSTRLGYQRFVLAP